MRQYSELLEGIARSSIQKMEDVLNEPTTNIKEILSKEDHLKQTPLFHACFHQNQAFSEKAVELLLEKGADPLHHDTHKQTVLSYLAKQGKQRIMKTLLDRYDFDLNEDDYINQTPLFWAVSRNHPNCVDLLIRKGADVNHIDSNGQNPIFYAASEGLLEMCKLLVNRQSSFQIIDNNRETPSHYARKFRRKAISDYFNGLKNYQKAKQKEISRLESSQQEEKTIRKKKETIKSECCLVYTNEKGEIRELSVEELREFSNASMENRQILELARNSNQLDSLPNPEEKKFEKIINKILAHFMKHEQGYLFLEPVNYIALQIPNYPVIVKNPMDFSTIKTKIALNCYSSEEDFRHDMNLVFDNCLLFNGKEGLYGKIAIQLKLQFNSMFQKEFVP